MGIIRVYQWTLSPLLGPRCRFYPSCSCYAHEAIERHGVLARHVARARSGCCAAIRSAAGGYDPVPDERTRLINA